MTNSKNQFVKAAPSLRSLSLEKRTLINHIHNKFPNTLSARTLSIYSLAVRKFISQSKILKSTADCTTFYIDRRQFENYQHYLVKQNSAVYTDLQALLFALKASFPGQFDELALRKLIRKHRPTKNSRPSRIVSLPETALPSNERAFVQALRLGSGFHRADDYRRFLGHIGHMFPSMLSLDFPNKFERVTFEPVLEAWLSTISSASSLQRFHLIAPALDTYLGTQHHGWIATAIRSKEKSLASHSSKAGRSGKTDNGPAGAALKTRADMRSSPLLDLMEAIAPTHGSAIRPSRMFRGIKPSSRYLIDGDFLLLINARIIEGIGSPEDPADEILSLASLKALARYLQRRMLDPRTIGRTLGRIRWLRKRLFPLDPDHGCLYLNLIGRSAFLSKPRGLRDVSHIDYRATTERLQSFLHEIEQDIKNQACRHSLREVEWRDFLIVAVMLVTGLRLGNVHGLKSEWIRLGPAPCLIIPAGSLKNGKPFACHLPVWLISSLLAYAPDLGNPMVPAFPVWRSRDTRSLSRSSVERSIKKISLALVNEALQPHDYRRLWCIFVQKSADIDPMMPHLATGHSDLETLLGIYPSPHVPGYLDDLLAPLRRRQSPDLDVASPLDVR